MGFEALKLDEAENIVSILEARYADNPNNFSVPRESSFDGIEAEIQETNRKISVSLSEYAIYINIFIRKPNWQSVSFKLSKPTNFFKFAERKKYSELYDRIKRIKDDLSKKPQSQDGELFKTFPEYVDDFIKKGGK